MLIGRKQGIILPAFLPVPSYLDFAALNNPYEKPRGLPSDLHNKKFEANDSSKALENWEQFFTHHGNSVFVEFNLHYKIFFEIFNEHFI